MTGLGGSGDSGDKKKGFIGARLNEGKISNFQPSRKSTADDLLAHLSQDPRLGGGEAAELHQQLKQDPRTTLVGWVDHLFDCLAACEYEFNRNIERADLKVFIERPESSGASGGKLVLKGRLSLQGWSMFIRATPDLVESYVMPSDRAISFTVNPGQFSRLLQIRIIEQDAHVIWRLGERNVDWDEMPDLARQLLEALSKIANGDVDLEQDYLFLSGKPAQQPAVAPQPVSSSVSSPPPGLMQPESKPKTSGHWAILGDSPPPGPQPMGSGAILQAQPSSNPPPAANAAPPQQFASPPPANLQMPPPAAAPQPPVAPHPALATHPALASQPGVAPQPGPASHPALASQPAMAPPPGMAQQPAAASQPAAAAQSSQISEFLQTNLQQAAAPQVAIFDPGFDMLIASLDRELKRLSDEGARAFSNQDTEAAEKALRRTGKLRGLRAEMVSTFLRWKAGFNEE